MGDHRGEYRYGPFASRPYQGKNRRIKDPYRSWLRRKIMQALSFIGAVVVACGLLVWGVANDPAYFGVQASQISVIP